MSGDTSHRTNGIIASLMSGPRGEKLKIVAKRGLRTWKIFRMNRMGMAGLAILAAFVIMAALAGPVMSVLAFIGGWEYPYGPFDRVASIGAATPPSPEHWLGTDQWGFDILSRAIYGSRVSLYVGFVASVVSIALGSSVGIISGFFGGWKDAVLMRITDVFLVVPWLVLMIVLAYVLPGGPSVWKVVFVIGVTGWSSTARIVRAQVLSIKQRAFIERARAIGAGDMHIVKKHIFPNVFPLVFANAILTVALSILSESTLSFIGLGPDSNDVVTWGNMLEDALSASAPVNGYYLWITIPGVFIVLVVLGFTFIGYALDEIVNPKLRKR